ncbi:hypothetical protein FACS1894219_10530 [Clostridia bacterium]|nr:hypothetical protein FACS1894219_10530 [Clostridia bacterium]
MPEKIPYRQIHLDFHTSPLIDGVGAKFDPEEWVATLKNAHVNSINVMGKCMHGMFYYPTKVGTQHPGLHGFNLLGEQAKVLHRENIRFCIYTSMYNSEDTLKKHPEWQSVDMNGVSGGRKPFDAGWRDICISKPGYKQLIKDELREEYELFRPTGFWIDILFPRSCVCPDCLANMKKLGINPQNDQERAGYNESVVLSFIREMHKFIKEELSPDLQTYFNSSHTTNDMADNPEYSGVEKAKYLDFVDLESVAGGGWSYEHFPVLANAFNKYPKEITLMNGKFHKGWGDFGSMRSLAGLEFECFRAIANGAKVAVGDQMHPCAKLDPAVYDRIGKVFASIEAKEPWLKETTKISEIGALLPTPTLTYDNRLAADGVYRVLNESKIPFDFVNYLDDISKYKLLILPDYAVLSQEMADKINDFTKAGGKLLATGRSGLIDDKFVLNALPVIYKGKSEYTTRYLRLDGGGIFAAIPQMDHVLYWQGETVEAIGGAEVSARIVPPYFNRSYEHFSSHCHTAPMLEASDEPAVVSCDGAVYISSPLFSDYAQNGYTVHKEILVACIKKLIGRLLIEVDLPNLSEVTLRGHENGVVVHTLSYAITRRCRAADTVDDAIELYNKKYSVYTGFKPSKVAIVPEGSALEFSYGDGYTTYMVPCQNGHSMVFISK